MDNYTISRDRAQAYFLGFDQQKLMEKWGLEADSQKLYVRFLGTDYAIHRQSGIVTRCRDGQQAQFQEVLSLFDLLCHEGGPHCCAGQFAPVNSLNGSPRAAAVETDFYSPVAAYFDKSPQAFCAACEALGAKPVAMGDLGFQFPVFQDLSVILKFYHADEEFPATLTLLWDSNMLQFVYYETVFYIAGFLLSEIQRKMKQAGSQ